MLQAEPIDWRKPDRRALTIDEQSFHPNHPRVATHLNNLGCVAKRFGQRTESFFQHTQ
jgi:hypothetical protein